ncbi:MAG TPA: Verru_Chthon cassette protein D, partial [Prosthecobacter sp.]
GLALTFSSDVELRFYKSPVVKPTDGSSGQTLQLMQWVEKDPTSNEGGVEQEQYGQDIAILKKIGSAETLPDGVAISDNNVFSTLWKLKSKTEQTAEGEREYVAIRFRPDGSTDLDETEQTPWSLTLVAQNELEALELPDNFYTVQIDPVTARLDVFRPE